MKTSIIKLYFEKKKKTLFQYTSLISNLIDMNDKYLISKKRENHILIKDILDKYVDTYLYQKDSSLKDEEFIKKYVDYNTNINKIVNLLMVVIINYYLDNGKKDTLLKQKEQLLLLAILISCVIKLDEKTNYLIEENIDNNYINNLLDEILVKNCKFNIKSNSKKTIKKLLLYIKENNNIENKLFENIDSLDIENVYTNYSNASNYYILKYKYNIKELENEEKYYVNEVFDKERIDLKLKNLSFYKLSSKILSDLLSNKDNYYVIELSEKELTIPNFNKLDKVFSNNIIRNRIVFLVSYENKNVDVVKSMKEKGYKILVDYNEVKEEKNVYMFNDDDIILVKDEFLEINKNNIDIWNNRNISFQTRIEYEDSNEL